MTPPTPDTPDARDRWTRRFNRAMLLLFIALSACVVLTYAARWLGWFAR